MGVNGLDEKYTDLDAIAAELGAPGPDRIWAVGDAFRLGIDGARIGHFAACPAQPLDRLDLFGGGAVGHHRDERQPQHAGKIGL